MYVCMSVCCIQCPAEVSGVMLVTPGAILFEADAFEEASVAANTASAPAAAVTPDTYNMIAPMESIVNIVITHELVINKLLGWVKIYLI